MMEATGITEDQEAVTGHPEATKTDNSRNRMAEAAVRVETTKEAAAIKASNRTKVAAITNTREVTTSQLTTVELNLRNTTSLPSSRRPTKLTASNPSIISKIQTRRRVSLDKTTAATIPLVLVLVEPITKRTTISIMGLKAMLPTAKPNLRVVPPGRSKRMLSNSTHPTPVVMAARSQTTTQPTTNSITSITTDKEVKDKGNSLLKDRHRDSICR